MPKSELTLLTQYRLKTMYYVIHELITCITHAKPPPKRLDHLCLVQHAVSAY